MMSTINFQSSESRLVALINGKRIIIATRYFWLNMRMSIVYGEYRYYSLCPLRHSIALLGVVCTRTWPPSLTAVN